MQNPRAHQGESTQVLQIPGFHQRDPGEGLLADQGGQAKPLLTRVHSHSGEWGPLVLRSLEKQAQTSEQELKGKKGNSREQVQGPELRAQP